jgi:iron complex outermembrane recepter protein
LNTKTSLIVFILFLIGIGQSVRGQVFKDTTALAEVVITASPTSNTLLKSASSISILNTQALENGDGVILTPILNRIPGIQMQQGALNTNRITIRGIGARTPFGTTKIKIYFDEIPLTTAEGESVLEEIEIASLAKIEINKGPNTTSFGAGLGGVIHLYSQEGNKELSAGKWNSTFGSFGLQKHSLSGNLNSNTWNLFTNYTLLESDGFRENSAYSRQTFHLKGDTHLGKKNKISFLGIATRLKAFIPSSLNAVDFENNPEIAASNWKAAKGYESYDKVVLGISHEVLLHSKLKWSNSLFTTIKSGYEARPFDILEDVLFSYGIRSKIKYSETLLNIPFVMSLGTELMKENYRNSLFENLYLNNPQIGSVEGDKFNSTQQNRNYANYFFQLDAQIAPKFQMETGLALNYTQYKQQNIFNTPKEPYEKYSFVPLLLPRLGLTYKLSDKASLYASISKGFSMPAVAETLTPEGNLNASLVPEIGINYEAGFKSQFLDKKGYFEMALYQTDIQNLLVAQRTAEDQYVGRNVGQTRHIGLEMQLNYRIYSTEKLTLNTFTSWHWIKAKFVNFLDNDVDYSGKILPGIPEIHFNLGWDISLPGRLKFTNSYSYTDSMYLNDANTLSTQSFRLVDCKIDYTVNVLEILNLKLYAGLQNLLNEKYAASLLPNAVGFGNQLPRYFYPGTPFNYYGGVQLVYTF